MTLFDIVMPYYGDVPMMQAAVRSVIAQTDESWRLTVVDDGQAAGVPEWFAGLGDPRIRYQRNEANLGVLGNFRKCVSLVEYERTVIMGSDDLMFPNYLAVIRSVLDEHPTVAMVQPGVQVIDGAGEPGGSLVDTAKKRIYAPREPGRLLLSGEELAVSLLRGDWLYFPSLCWRSDALKEVGFRDGLEIIQDLALIIDLVQRGEALAVDPAVCFQYRRHQHSASSTSAVAGSRFGEAKGYFLEVADRMQAQGWPRAAKAARRHFSTRVHALTMLPGAVLGGQRESARALLGFTFRN
ncbi:MAG TPA: glycosyltransferase family A protein [Actinocrinis sp.]|nr:glycosyltransferase family A protein [Actinocrinis sp.]